MNSYFEVLYKSVHVLREYSVWRREMDCTLQCPETIAYGYPPLQMGSLPFGTFSSTTLIRYD